MPGLYASASLLLCRSGATTVAEATVVGVPAVYVPWAGSAEGQQEANAAAVVDAGGGVVLAQFSDESSTMSPLVGKKLYARMPLPPSMLCIPMRMFPRLGPLPLPQAAPRFTPRPLTAWAEYAHALILANEFTFVN